MSDSETRIEYWDLYRMDGRFEQTIIKGSMKIPEHLYHETVEIIPTDMEGRLLITRRAQGKRIAGGKFEFPAGSVLSGETPVEACRRELREETGLKAKRMYKLSAQLVPGLKRYIYLAYIPDLVNAEVTLQEGETIAHALVTFEEWLQYVADLKFDENRLMMYTKSVVDSIEKMVGVPKDTEPSKPALRLLKPSSEFAGTRRGTSGTDVITDDKDMDLLETDPIVAFNTEEEDYDEETQPL